MENQNGVIENQNNKSNEEQQIISIRASKEAIELFREQASEQNITQGEHLENLSNTKEDEKRKIIPKVTLNITDTISKVYFKIRFNGRSVYTSRDEDITALPSTNERLSLISSFLGSNSKYNVNYSFEIFEKLDNLGKTEDFLVYEKIEIRKKQSGASNLKEVIYDYFLTSEKPILSTLKRDIPLLKSQLELINIVAHVNEI